MAVRTVSNAGGNWNATTAWVEGAVPTAADDVVDTATSGNLTLNVNCFCRSFVITNLATLAHSASVILAIGDATAGAGNVAFRLHTGIVYTRSAGAAIQFVSTSSTVQTVDPVGKDLGFVTFNGVGGSWRFSSGFITSTGGNCTLTAGTLDLNGQTFSWGIFNSNNSNVRALLLGASAVTLIGTGTVWNIVTSTNLALTPATSTIVLSNVSATGKTFAGGGKTYNVVSITTGGAGAVTFTGSNTFARLTNSGGSTKTVIFTVGTTTTLTGDTNAFFSGASGNLITIQSSSAGSAFSLSKAGAGVSVDYLSLKDSTATGGAQWFAGANSTSVSGNAGWVLTVPGWARSLSDTAEPTDASTKATGKTADDTAGLADTVGKAVAYFAADDSVGAVDAITGKAVGKAAADTASAVDVLAREWLIERLVDDSTAAVDDVFKRIEAGHADVVSVADALVRAYQLNPVDVLEAADVFASVWQAELVVADTVSLLDAIDPTLILDLFTWTYGGAGTASYGGTTDWSYAGDDDPTLTYR